MVLETILGGLGGAVARLATSWFKYRDDKDQRAHEFRMTQLQLDIDAARAKQQLDLTHVQGDIARDVATMSAYQEALRATGGPATGWVAAFSGLIRPLLTVWWCLFLYSAYKAILISVALADSVPLTQMASVILTDFDAGVVSSMIGFWFVDRALGKPGK